MQYFGDYYLPGRDFTTEGLDKFLQEEEDLEKLWLDNKQDYEDICLEHSFRKVAFKEITTLDLEKTEDQLWSEMDRKRRNSIRKAMNSGISVRKASSEDIEEFTEVYIDGFCSKHNMNDAYISRVPSMVRNWINNEDLFIAILDEKIIAGTSVNQSRFLNPGETLVYSNNTSLLEFQKFYPNDLLIWEIVKQAKIAGFHTFNMCGGNMFKRKFSKMDPMIVNEWMKKSVIPYILIIASEAFFHNTVDKTEKEYRQNIERLICKLGERGFYVEVEEVTGCLKGKFHKTGTKKFDYMVQVEINPKKNNHKSGLQDQLRNKSWSESEIGVDFYENLEAEDVFLLPFISDYTQEFSTIEGSVINAKKYQEALIKELSYSMEEGRNSRIDMIVRCLISSAEDCVRDISEIMWKHPNIVEISNGIGTLLAERSLLVNVEMDFIDKRDDFEEISFLTRMAISESKISAEVVKKALSQPETMDIARSLFLEAQTLSSGRVFLNLSNGGKKWGGVSDAWIMNNFWKHDHEVLQHWTYLSPDDHESWQIRTRALWDAGIKSECARISEEGLEFHPNSPQLLRRKAHGHRERGETSEAIEIEMRLFEEKSDQLILIDTILYLVRGLCNIREWDKALKYIGEGLAIDPDQAELLKKRNLVMSKKGNK